MIKYGTILELYKYEKSLSNNQNNKLRTRSSRSTTLSVLDSDREAEVSVQREKRKDNARRSAMVFRRLVSANLDGVVRPLLFTFTYAENMQDLSRGYADFRAYIQALRYQFGKEFSYIAVPEFQKRGAVHFHALFWYLPLEFYRRERHTRFFSSLWGHGFVYIKPTDGNEKLSSYLAKYMSKAYTDARLCFQKAFTASRNIKRPLVQSLPLAYDVLSDYKLSTVNLLHSTRYMTQWLGACDKHIYKLI